MATAVDLDGEDVGPNGVSRPTVRPRSVLGDSGPPLA